jgi:hypothetical protein
VETISGRGAIKVRIPCFNGAKKLPRQAILAVQLGVRLWISALGWRAPSFDLWDHFRSHHRRDRIGAWSRPALAAATDPSARATHPVLRAPGAGRILDASRTWRVLGQPEAVHASPRCGNRAALWAGSCATQRGFKVVGCSKLGLLGLTRNPTATGDPVGANAASQEIGFAMSSFAPSGLRLPSTSWPRGVGDMGERRRPAA